MNRCSDFLPKSKWIWGSVFLLALIISALSLVPTIVRNEIENFLTSQGLKDFSYQNISINIFTRELQFRELRLQTSDVQYLYIQNARAKISLIPLWNNKIKIRKLTIQDSEIRGVLGSEGTWNIGGLNLPLKSSSQAKNEPDWDVSTNNLEFRNTKLLITTPELAGTILLRHALFETRLRLSASKDAPGRHHIWRYKMDSDLDISWHASKLAVRTHIKTSGSWPKIVKKKQSVGFNARAQVNSLIITDNKNKLNVLQADSVNLDGIKVVKNALTIDQTRMNIISICTPLKDKNAASPFVRMDQANIQALRWVPDKILHLDKLSLKNTRLNAYRYKTGKWKSATKLMQTTSNGSKKSKQTRPKTGAHKQSLHLLVNTIELDSDAYININDRTVSPPVKTKIKLNRNSELKNLDSKKPDNKSPIRLTGSIGDYGNFDISGNVQFFAPQTAYDLKAQINNLDLPPLSPYTVPDTGYEITHGHLDINTSIAAIQGQIKGNSELTFKKLKARPVDQAAIEKFTARLTMPLETVMLLLEDKKNRIRLDVPISGSTDNPRFSFTDVLNKAVIAAMRTASLGYLKYYFQPYGALVTIIQLGEKVFKMRLDPVFFTAGSSTLNQKSKEYLAGISTLMKDKKRLKLSICGKTVPEDEITDINQANILARARSENVRDFLVKELIITPDRLYICQSEPETDPDAKARAELEF